MIFFYSAIVLALGIAAFLARRQAAALEAKFTRIARETDRLARQHPVKEGNSNRQDPYEAAKRLYALALVGQKRDRVEARFLTWRQRSDKLNALANRVRGWKGLKLPYTFGALDVATVLWLIDRLGFADAVGARHLLELLRTFLSR
jgi:hypothetical protein